MENIINVGSDIRYTSDNIKKCKENAKMKEKENEKTLLSNILRIIVFVEAVGIIVLSVILFYTKNVSLIRVLFVVGIITALFAIFILFLKLTGILDTNPNSMGNIASAFLLLSICCALIASISGIPTILDFVNSQKALVDSLNKSIESVEKLPNFMETQTAAMNNSVILLEEIHDIIVSSEPK